MNFKVVIVDDDSVVLFLHKMLVEQSVLPSVCASFKNGKDAMEFIAENNLNDKPYLVLLDINMPVMNGWEFLEAVQKLKGNDKVYVAMVTSSINSYDLEKAQKYPQVIDYLEKPLRKDACEKLHNKMNELLE